MSDYLGSLELQKDALPAFRRLHSEAQDALSALTAAHSRHFEAGRLLKLEGEDAKFVFFVFSGWLLTSKTLAEGQRQIIDIILPGGILEPVSADLETSAVEIETLTDCSISVIPKRDWYKACEEHAQLAKLNRQVIGAAYSRVAERMLRLGKAPAETTIAFVLCELSLRSSAHGLIEGASFHIPMTQQQLGDVCGLSAVHICRTLRRLERNGVLSVTDHMDIQVHDIDALAEIAQIDPEILHNEIIAAA